MLKTPLPPTTVTFGVSRDLDPPLANRDNRMKFTFIDNYGFLKQFWIGASRFDQFSTENDILANIRPF